MKMGRRRSPAKRLLIVTVIVLMLFVFFDRGMRSAITDTSQTYAQNLTNEALNNAVQSVLSKNSVDYSALVTLQTDDSSNITAIQTDTVKMNQLKSEISAAAQQNLTGGEFSSFEIPVGTFTGSDFLMGRGPKVTFKLQYTSGMSAEYENIFDSAGINQTRHQIMLKITATVYLVTSWHNTPMQVEAQYLIAETILVGGVPDAYTNITRGSASDEFDIANYGASSN